MLPAAALWHVRIPNTWTWAESQHSIKSGSKPSATLTNCDQGHFLYAKPVNLGSKEGVQGLAWANLC